MIILILLLILFFMVGVIIGTVAAKYLAVRAGKYVKSDSSSPARDQDGYTQEEKTSYWRIVRYVNGHFDAVWSSLIYDKRVADKKCAALNDPNSNEHFYGTYIVEPD